MLSEPSAATVLAIPHQSFSARPPASIEPETEPSSAAKSSAADDLDGLIFESSNEQKQLKLQHLVAALEQPRRALGLWQLKDGVVKLLSELDTVRSDFVNRLAELGLDSEDTAIRLDVGTLLLRIIDTGRGDDEVLDGGAGVLRDYDAGGEEEPVERHGLDVVLSPIRQ
ncbi:hypothetical protein HMN09_00644200 [Mycena chlorophos]|uniref:Uncharacterized protein n=1 Tax=Mycena chlorophos TaxID=658473 RepID=A0A8H6T3H3_MYCCL|nr:hypothetical protein HMN09_00644200 [Mycena chlorophos]